MQTMTCLCGQVTVTAEKSPDFIHACNCTLCSKSGAWWGYFSPGEVTVTGETRGYVRQDKARPACELRFCPKCGSTTHFVLTEAAIAVHGNTMAGVNMRLAPESDLAGIELRFPDGRGWAGEGPFEYVQASRILGG